MAACCGLPRVPILVELRRGRPVPIAADGVLALTATLEALANLAPLERVGRAELPALGLQAEVSLGPAEAPARPRRRPAR